MDIQDARKILGVGPATPAEEIKGAWQAKRADLDRRIAAAPDDGLRKKFQQSLSGVDLALDALLGGSGAAAGLRASQIRDLGRAQSHGTAAGAGPDATLAPGTVLRGRYVIVSLLAKGGMGAVYEAEDREDGERIALKVLLPRLAVDRDAQARFRNEGKIARKLLHQGCVRVYDVDSDGELYFLTMEVLRGCTLREVMNERQKSGRGFAVAEVLQIARELGDALVYAHSQDVVHRDVKPENIWVTKEGRYKLLDFGLAKVPTASDFTQAAQQMGTAYYVAPEQLQGSRTVDHRADQYSLAVVLYEAACGDKPIARSASLKRRNPTVSKDVSDAIDKALSPAPGERHLDMSTFVKCFPPPAEVSSERARSIGYRYGRWLGKLRFRPVVGLLFLVFALVVGVLFLIVVALATG